MMEIAGEGSIVRARLESDDEEPDGGDSESEDALGLGEERKMAGGVGGRLRTMEGDLENEGRLMSGERDEEGEEAEEEKLEEEVSWDSLRETGGWSRLMLRGSSRLGRSEVESI